MSNADLSFFHEGTNGKGVLLIHGLTGVPAEMKWVGRALNRQGYTVYAPLLAGHGKDEKTLTQTRWRHWLQSVEEAAEFLRKQVDHMFATGICVGGKLGMMAAHQKPGLFKAVAIYSPCFRYDGWNVPPFYRVGDLLLPFARLPILRKLKFGETPTIGIKDERLRKAMQKLSTQGVIDDFPAPSLLEMQRLSRALKKNLGKMTTPTLILHARNDDLSHPRHAHYIERNLKGPRQLQWLEDSYHMIHVDREHDKVAAMTARYFEQSLNA